MENVETWKRPESVPLPSVWMRYESKKPMPNGKRPKFRIQDYTEEWREPVIHNMVNFFLNDEVLCKSLGLREDPVAVEEFKELFLSFLEKKTALIAIVENLDELGDEKLPALAGCNITGIVTDKDKPKKGRSEKTIKILNTLEMMDEKLNCFKHYQVKELMYALGLSVDPAFRGHDLGHQILRARFPLCKAVGVKVTVTVFTGGAAQRAAEKAGFEDLLELFYKDIKDEKGNIIFNIDQPKSMKLMGYRIQ